MAADVDICNLALSFLGDTATVASINPPSGSAQSSHCSRFYPVARDALLGMHAWSFATQRIALAQVTNPTVSTVNPNGTWAYAYASPSGVLDFLAVLDPNAVDDYASPIYNYTSGAYAAPQPNIGIATPQPFVVETDSSGNEIILTNQANALLRYVVLVSDTTKFSPLFVVALARLLASMLAGPLLKGDEGRKESQAQLQLFDVALAKATAADSDDRRVRPAPGAPWMVNR